MLDKSSVSKKTSNLALSLCIIVVFIVAPSTWAADSFRLSSGNRLTLSRSSRIRSKSASISNARTSTGGCEPVQLPMCKTTMPYSRTRMPNLLDHATQRNARLVLDQYQMLIKTGCGVVVDDFKFNGGSGKDVMAFYLCAVFAPICPMGFEQVASASDSDHVDGDDQSSLERRDRRDVGRRRSRYGSSGTVGVGSINGGQLIPPCRGVCEKARAGCEPVMKRYNVSWPEELNCSRWPTQDRGVCISPETIDWRRRTRADRGPDCRCIANETRLSTRDAYLQSNFDYVIHVTYKRSKRLRNADVRDNGVGRTASTSKTVLTFRMLVRQILKLGSSHVDQLIAENTTVSIVWASTTGELGASCTVLCAGGGPRHSAAMAAGLGSLRRGEDYLIMGYVDTRNQQLIVNNKSVIEPWKKNWPVYIKKWEKRLSSELSRDNENPAITTVTGPAP